MRKFFVIVVVALLFLLMGKSDSVLAAANRTWDGGGGADTNWSTCANWDGPNICPVAGDTATFDGTSTNNSTIDSGFGGSIGNINVNSGYTGTITQAETLAVTSTMTLSAGTYSASNQSLSVAATFTMNTGSTFTASSGTTTFTGGFTINGGTFNANGGTVNFNAAQTLACNNISFNLVTFTHAIANTTTGSGCQFPLGANPTIGSTTQANIVSNGSSFSGSGTLTILGTSTFNSGSSISGFSDVAANVFTVAGANLNLSTVSSFSSGGFTLSSGSFTAPASMNLRGSFNQSGGVFNHNNGTVALVAAVSVTIAGSNTFYNLTHVTTGNLVMTAGTTQTVLGTLTMQGLTSRFTMRSSVAGTSWKIDAQGGRLLSNIAVSDSLNLNSNVMIASNSLDSGGNTNWLFTSNPVISFYLDYPGGNSHITNTNPTYRWRKATSSVNSTISKYELYIQPKDLITNTNIGTRLYIDNIIPFVGDNKKYAYYTNYTLYDDGDFLNLTPTSYKLTAGKYNFRVVAHDSAGNVREESLDFFVDGTTLTPTSKPVGNYVAQSGSPTNQSQPETSQPVVETPTPEAADNFAALAGGTSTLNFKWWWILILVIFLLIVFFLLWRRKRQNRD